MVLYVYSCPRHGEVEVRKPMAQAGELEYCPLPWQKDYPGICDAPMTRVYTPPITDCKSFGRNQYGARTPAHLRRPRSEDQARDFRDAARKEGARVQFGAGKTTGS